MVRLSPHLLLTQCSLMHTVSKIGKQYEVLRMFVCLPLWLGIADLLGIENRFLMLNFSPFQKLHACHFLEIEFSCMRISDAVIRDINRRIRFIIKKYYLLRPQNRFIFFPTWKQDNVYFRVHIYMYKKELELCNDLKPKHLQESMPHFPFLI